MEAKDTDWTYTLNCRNCGIPYETGGAFPEPQYCPKCFAPFNAGIREVDKEFQISEQVANMKKLPGVPLWIAIDWEKWQVFKESKGLV